MPDAVVIGAGHNGLVAAAMLADAGWSVAVLEAQPRPGGAVRTDELTLPGYRHDTFSAFYPFAVASRALASLDLGAHGLRWRRAPVALAHPTSDGRCAVLSTDLDETAASLDSYASGDGDRWRRLYRRWLSVSGPLLDSLCTPFPPVVAGARMAAAIGPSDLLRFSRFALLPVRRMAEEEFAPEGYGGQLLLAGNAAHTDIGPEAALSGFFGWVLAGVAQQHGFPVPEGGAGELVAALCRRAEGAGATVTCNAAVTEVVVRRGRAVAVRTADGTEIDATRAVLADVDAPTLFMKLVGPRHLPPRVLDDIRRFDWDTSTFKLDWALDAPVPWMAEAARKAGTVHVGDSVDEISLYFNQLARGAIPARPFVLFGQQSVADPSRCPPGTATAWAYTHVPRRARSDAGGSLTGAWGEAEAEAFADRIEARVEELAPGFRSGIRARHLLTPAGFEAADANLVAGGISAGTQQLHQQLVFRPTPGLGRPTTPIAGLFLAGASAHPGGGVHGACGANAARTALAADRVFGRVRRRVRSGVVQPAGRRRTDRRPPSARTS